MFFFGFIDISEIRYRNLKKEREDIQLKINNLINELSASNREFTILKAIYEPDIKIIEVNNKTMGHRYIGRVNMPAEYEFKGPITISIGKVIDFKSKDDPRIYELAREKLITRMKKEFPLFY